MAPEERDAILSHLGAQLRVVDAEALLGCEAQHPELAFVHVLVHLVRGLTHVVEREDLRQDGLDPAEAGPAGLGSTLQLLFQIMDDLADIRVYFHPVLDQTTGVQDGAMVAPAERFANRVQ